MPASAAAAIASGVATHMLQPSFATRIAIVYAPIAMKPTCPKLSRPASPNCTCSPSVNSV